MIRLYTDATVSGNPGQAGIGLLFLFDKEQKQLAIPLTNSQWDNHLAEFRALFYGLTWVVNNQLTDQITFCDTDNQIVAQSIKKGYVKDDKFNQYLQHIQKIMREFLYISVE